MCRASGSSRPGPAPSTSYYWVRGAYREVVAPERLVITCTAHDEEGIARLEEVINASFAEHGGKTKLVLNTTPRGPSDAQMKSVVETKR